MERTGGEPDVVGLSADSGEVIFTDCVPESPEGRRALCYDQAALEARKKNKPAGSAVGMADEMGVVLLTEAEYRSLQQLGEFDLKTSSWVLTPRKSVTWVVRCSVTGALIPSSSITTAPIPITAPVGSGPRCGCSYFNSQIFNESNSPVIKYQSPDFAFPCCPYLIFDYFLFSIGFSGFLHLCHQSNTHQQHPNANQQRGRE